MDSPESGGLGGTYNGNPLGCVAANAVLDIIEEENLVDRSNKLGIEVTSFLLKLKSKYPIVTDVRGIGSMIAIEVVDTSTAQKIQKQARELGLILIMAGVNTNVIRFLYPLTISDKVLNDGLTILDAAFNRA
jgi:4-aminobutyrate aminotransferase